MDIERIAYWDGDKICHCKRKECFFKNRIKEELGDRTRCYGNNF